MTSICKLCLKDLPPRKSHIIPEFLYKPLYDEKHRMHVLSINAKRPKPREQKGLREKLLCDDCEGYLSKLETYACEAFYEDNGVEALHEEKFVRVKNLNYKQIKLFLLSVVWRASVSSLEFFEQVNLGPHEEVIRRMLIDADPGPTSKYGVIPFALLHEGEIQIDLIVQPTWTRLNGHFGYRFIFGGFLWFFMISKHNPPSEIRSLFISEDNTAIIVLSELQKYQNIIKFAQELKELGRL